MTRPPAFNATAWPSTLSTGDPEEPPEVSGTLLFACGEVPASEEADAVDSALEAKRRERRQRFNTRPETAPPA